MLVERSLAQGWRVEVRGTRLMPWQNWTTICGAIVKKALFPTHARAGRGRCRARDPDGSGIIGYDCILCVDGAELSADEVNAAEQACLIFDGQNDQARRRHGPWNPAGADVRRNIGPKKRKVGAKGAKKSSIGALGRHANVCALGLGCVYCET